jgi:hypothetical protein
MRYVITKDQFHKIVYGILDELSEGGKVEKEINPYVKSGKTYRLNMFDKDGNNFITYFYYEPGEDDDGNPHDGHGSIHVDWTVNDKIKKLFSLRQTKVHDIIADWVTDKFGVDVDEVDVYPTKPSRY